MSVDVEKIKCVEQTLRKWSQIPNFSNIPPAGNDIYNMREAILIISKDIEQQFPIISAELDKLRHQLFHNNGMGTMFINPCVLGQIVEALSILSKEINGSQENMWGMIHPKICKCSQKLFEDGSYINSTVDAFVEINDRLKKFIKY